MKKDIITVSTVTFNATWGDKAKNLNRIKGLKRLQKKVPILLFSRKWHLPVMMMKRKNQRPKKCSPKRLSSFLVLLL